MNCNSLLSSHSIKELEECIKNQEKLIEKARINDNYIIQKSNIN